jgi:hypothetical protein
MAFRDNTPMPSWKIGDPMYVSNHHNVWGDLLASAGETAALTWFGYKIARLQIKAGANLQYVETFAFNASWLVNAWAVFVGFPSYLAWFIWFMQTLELPAAGAPELQHWVMGTMLLWLVLRPLNRYVKKGIKQWVTTPVRTMDDMATPWWLIGRMVTHVLAILVLVILFVVVIGGST